MGKYSGLTKHEKYQQLQARVSPELYERLLFMTETEGTSITFVVNKAIDEAVTAFEAKRALRKKRLG